MRRHPWHLLGIASLLFAITACSESGSLPTQGRLSVDNTSGAAKASGGSGGSRTLPVTSTISDDASFQIKSDGLGAYKSSSNLQSEIQSATSGDWVLDSFTPANGTRMVYLDFGRPVAGSGPNGGAPVAIPSGYYKFHMISKCHLTGNSFLTIAPGQTVQCPLRIGQSYVGARQYGVTMNSGVTSSEVTWPETNYANVTCNSTAGTCASWTLTPSGTAPDGSSANVAVLIETVTSTNRGKTTTTDVKQGDFYMSFRIDITNP
jgi:hypothetical protein